MNLEQYLASRRELVDKALDDMLPGEDNEPAILHKAMRYSIFAGGKRIRPALAMASAEAVGGKPAEILPLAVALECIHTYSLVHDDLPAMDNDDLRRGKPTAHKVFGEAVAILAGDALLTFGLGVLSLPNVARMYRLDRLVPVIHELSVAAGSTRLIAGQVMDIVFEGKEVTPEIVGSIMANKTGALIRASLVCGAMLAGGDSEEVGILGRFGELLGTVFQIRDDLLDIEGDPAKLGKAVGKDNTRGKATFARVVGTEKTIEMMQTLTTSALETIEPLGKRVEPLIAVGKYIGIRTS
ncbi:MAG: polyprenyl synthetase family protein [Desulfomonile tiedjei]|uniref:Polyprenyl synthetase family protein n=1 Tax=Desulfomonile tiedjei TaxID=2358 RepID=A0A9D6V4C5_9BACT|nr:polyprenyl synthetase family protein [Desulfomonile tiedjei]